MVVSLLLIASCSGEQPDTPAANAPPAPAVHQQPSHSEALLTVAQQQLDAALETSAALQQKVAQLLGQPSAAHLAQAQNAWQPAASAIEALHLLSRLGAIPHSPYRSLISQHYQIAAWPIAPGYLDAYGEHSYSGLVFDLALPLSAQTLRQQHGLTSSSEAALGIYAIEYLLFGEHNRREPEQLQAIRALNKHQRAEGYQHVDELPRNRRRQLLQLQTHLLVEDIQQFQQDWTAQSTTLNNALLQRAAQLMVADQIVAVARQQPPQAALAPAQQHRQDPHLAQRLAAQLLGWHDLVQVSALADQTELARLTEQALAALPLPTQQAPQAAAGERVQHGQWQQVYRHLRELAAELSPKYVLPEEPAGEQQALPAPINK